MGVPPRHGHGHSNMPVPLSPPGAKARAMPRGPTTTGQQLPVQPLKRGTPRSPAGFVPSTAMDSFLNCLPSPDIQQIALIEELPWNDWDIRTRDVLTVLGEVVPEQMVYLFTDIYFFAMTPSEGLVGASEYLPTPALNGLLRFQLLFNQTSPMQLEGTIVNQQEGGALVQQGRRGGWPLTNKLFGTKRSSGWGVYAMGGSVIEATATVDRLPQFPMTLLGVELHGFSLSELAFRDKVSKDWQGVPAMQP